MERLLKPHNLPWAALSGGILGALLRILLIAAGTDERGLPVENHFANILLWVLTCSVAALLVYMTRDLKQAPKYSFNFPPSAVAAAGAAVAAAGVLISSISQLFSDIDGLTILDALLGLLCTAALLFISRCRWKGLHPSVIFHVVVCIYLMVDLVCVYRIRSADPQVQEYCFSLLASVCIMLASYYNAAFAANAGDRRLHTLSHLAAVFFCLQCLPRCENPVFYLTMAAWLLTDLCNLTPMPRRMR